MLFDYAHHTGTQSNQFSYISGSDFPLFTWTYVVLKDEINYFIGVMDN